MLKRKVIVTIFVVLMALSVTAPGASVTFASGCPPLGGGGTALP